ncbi:hypothetical protein [Natronorubrum halophilum]|uniref:hypothetical protein n=1 Tax=Natronorubrum halophilum TaxID=1702106 RepID=UPI0010C1F0BB|nr:hypothetical protein [Natronorubrum halophilum]
MTVHRADCEDCAWSYSDEDLVDVSDEMERHVRKEMHDVDLERAVATDGGHCVDGTERETDPEEMDIAELAHEYLRSIEREEEAKEGVLTYVLEEFVDPGYMTWDEYETVKSALDAGLLDELRDAMGLFCFRKAYTEMGRDDEIDHDDWPAKGRNVDTDSGRSGGDR